MGSDTKRRDESRRGTQKCVRHRFQASNQAGRCHRSESRCWGQAAEPPHHALDHRAILESRVRVSAIRLRRVRQQSGRCADAFRYRPTFRPSGPPSNQRLSSPGNGCVGGPPRKLFVKLSMHSRIVSMVPRRNSSIIIAKQNSAIGIWRGSMG